MSEPSEIPESIESNIEGIRREAAVLSDYRLDALLAVVVARRDVAVAHGLVRTAEAWADLTVALDDARQVRAEVRREIEELTSPRRPGRPVAEIVSEDSGLQEPPC